LSISLTINQSVLVFFCRYPIWDIKKEFIEITKIKTSIIYFQATAEANNLAAKSSAKEFYIRAMEQVKPAEKKNISI